MKDTESTNATEVPAVAGRLDLGLGPLPEAGMTEMNPYLDLGPLDPHKGAQILTWYSADQMRAYAAEQVAAERERWRVLMLRSIRECFDERAYRQVMSDPQHFAAEALKA